MIFFFFSSRRRHTRWTGDWSSDVCSSDLDASRKQFGWAYVADGGEDTVWRYEAMLWQAGGDSLSPDNREPAFNSPAGMKALTLLHDMATVDHSIYLDNGNGNYLGLFDAGKIGMLWTGPWDLADIRDHRSTMASRCCRPTRTTRRSPARTTG